MGEQQSGKEQSRVDEILDAQIEKQISEFWDQVDPRDPYSVLMMPPQSELRDIKRKYRALMLSFHSDKTTSLAISDQHKIDLSEIAQAINQAYTYLTRGDNGRPFLLFESNRMRKSKKGESVDPESTLPHGEALSSLDTSQLKAGDFIHVKTRNSYYVFEVFFDESGKPSAKFSSGPSTLSGAMGRLSTSVEVGERFNVGTASTSDVVEMRINRQSTRIIEFER